MTELLEKLYSEKAALLEYLYCVDDNDISKVKKDIADTEAGLKKLNEQEERYSSKLNAALKEYAELRKKGAEFDPQELYEARQAIRSDKEQLAEQQLKKAYGDKYNAASMLKCRQEVSRLLNEDTEKRVVNDKVKPYQKRDVNQRMIKKRNKGMGR